MVRVSSLTLYFPDSFLFCQWMKKKNLRKSCICPQASVYTWRVRCGRARAVLNRRIFRNDHTNTSKLLRTCLMNPWPFNLLLRQIQTNECARAFSTDRLAEIHQEACLVYNKSRNLCECAQRASWTAQKEWDALAVIHHHFATWRVRLDHVCILSESRLDG